MSLEIFRNKTLLITGGTGTFGHAVLRRFMRANLKEIRIFSRDEKKQDDMRTRLKAGNVRFHLGDVRNLDSVTGAMQGADFVFHAAALKQVPSCEFYPMEAIRTNTLGADNVMNAAIACSVQSVILLSTDKAVYPINAMGMSKALMEKLMVAKARAYMSSGTVLCGTRYGNVMASRGSVIPLFVSQILARQPLTLTDPNMTRFMMSIEDAVDLVLHAFVHGKSGDMFVQKSPASTIGTLAQALLKLFEARSGTRVIGTRHGEKLFETLLTREEMAHAVSAGSYFCIPADTRGQDYASYVSEGEPGVSPLEDYNSHNTRRLDVEETMALVSKLDVVDFALRNGRMRGDQEASEGELAHT